MSVGIAGEDVGQVRQTESGPLLLFTLERNAAGNQRSVIDCFRQADFTHGSRRVSVKGSCVFNE